MRKLSEYKDDESLDLLAELLEPCVELFSDKTLVEKIRKSEKISAIKYAIKSHKKEVVEVMALLNETPVKDFHYNLFTLPVMMLDVLNDEELMDFFLSVVKKDSPDTSGKGMETTEEEGDISSDT